MSDLPDEDDAAIRKRKAIQAVMRDSSLSGAERGRRIQSIMAGKFDPTNSNSNSNSDVGKKEEEEEEERGAANAANDDDDPEGGRGGVGFGSVTLPEEHFPPPPANTGGRSSRRGGSALSSIDEWAASRDDDQGTAARGPPPPRRRPTIDEWAASQDGEEVDVERPPPRSSSRRRSSIDEWAETQEGGGGNNNGTAARRSSQVHEEGTGGNTSSSSRRSSFARQQQGQESRRSFRGGHPAAAFTSLDEWAAEQDPSEREGSNGDGGPRPQMAVAHAVAGDDAQDEPDYIFRAIEYDPEAKPPLHRNRRFRAYTYLAFGMIALVVILTAVYITSAAKRRMKYEYVDVAKVSLPTSSPSLSPITDREASGIIEQLEGGILHVRNELFGEMERDDPRLYALEWILHGDQMQLLSNDVNLYQRFALAVLAYSLDSEAWYYCGHPAANNYTEDQCYYFDEDENATLPYGDRTVWLSSTNECSWLGVTCSRDGIVRGVELVKNDLIGQLPYEITALRFLQLLALHGNCLYGTIPPELGSMTNLLSLELHENGLSGAVPPAMYHLKNLQLLNLANQYGVDRRCTKTDGRVVDVNYAGGGLDVYVGGRLEDNAGLTGTLGKEIGAWRLMKGLYLQQNSFEGEIADEIGGMRYLRFLQFSDNFIGGSLPSTITKLRNLKKLEFGDNFLVSSLPSDLGKLDDLESLMANGNSMYGELPDGLYNLTKLEKLRLDETLMREAPWLVVPEEGITGTISTLIGGLQDLQYLLLSNNPMSGTIPTELGLCEGLKVLRVHRTNISGTMPYEICLLRDKFLNSQTQGVLYSDCRPNNRTGDPFLKCECCSDCCDHSTGVCIQDD